MKKIVLFGLLVVVAACSSSKEASGKKPIYEILTTQNDGGATIRFYEILTEEKEIKMLQNDEHLKKKIGAEDLKSANFVILNMGEKTSGGYSVGIKSVEEKDDKVIITVDEKSPKPDSMNTSAITYPYTIVKINSKKPIEIK